MRILLGLAVPALTRGLFADQRGPSEGTQAVFSANQEKKGVAGLSAEVEVEYVYKNDKWWLASGGLTLLCNSEKKRTGIPYADLQGTITAAETGPNTLKYLKKEMIAEVKEDCVNYLNGYNSRTQGEKWSEASLELDVETDIIDRYQNPQRMRYICVWRNKKGAEKRFEIVNRKVLATDMQNKLDVPLENRFYYDSRKASEMCAKLLKEQTHVEENKPGHVSPHNP